MIERNRERYIKKRKERKADRQRKRARDVSYNLYAEFDIS
jgi:hypothetical protein